MERTEVDGDRKNSPEDKSGMERGKDNKGKDVIGKVGLRGTYGSAEYERDLEGARRSAERGLEVRWHERDSLYE